MNWKEAQQSWRHEAPYAAFWVTSAAAVACLVAAAIGPNWWVWFFVAVSGVFGSLHVLHRALQREACEAHEGELDRMMNRVQKRLQSSHPHGGVTFDDYVKALKAEGVPSAEKFAAEYPRPDEKPQSAHES